MIVTSEALTVLTAILKTRLLQVTIPRPCLEPFSHILPRVPAIQGDRIQVPNLSLQPLVAIVHTGAIFS